VPGITKAAECRFHKRAIDNRSRVCTSSKRHTQQALNASPGSVPGLAKRSRGEVRYDPPISERPG
jgi:hypothetical protein